MDRLGNTHGEDQYRKIILEGFKITKYHLLCVWPCAVDPKCSQRVCSRKIFKQYYHNLINTVEMPLAATVISSCNEQLLVEKKL